jgi:2-polyprenyl-6-methoxyphenol hydroxylase-like FAD-dependent oxidoreductase
MDAVEHRDVIVVGAGPTGLMLAAELRLAGVRPLVLERKAERRDTPKAGGLGGQILELLRYRGLMERFEAAAGPTPEPRFPFGGVHLDLTRLDAGPMHALALPQAPLERLLDERAAELGVEIRRGHEVVGLSQDDDSVTLEVQSPEGRHRVTARFVVGADGARSPIREWAGIAFPGTAYPEVNRLAQVTVPDTAVISANGDIEFPGIGEINAGFTRTGTGLFGLAASPETRIVSFYTAEEESAEYDDDVPMTLTELGDSVERVLGFRPEVHDPKRLSRFTFKARQAEPYRQGNVFVAGDAAHQFPATGVAINAGMLDAVNLAWKLAAEVQGWAPEGLLDTYHDERHLAGARTMLHTQAQVALRRGHDAAADALRAVFQELLDDEPALRRLGALLSGADVKYAIPGAERHPLIGAFAPDLPLDLKEGRFDVADLMPPARPVLLILTDRPDLADIAEKWSDRVDLITATTPDRPADALLIRPDAHIAWAATLDEPADSAATTLEQALTTWFGKP